MNSESDSPIDIINSSGRSIPVILNDSVFDSSKYQILEVPEQIFDQVLSNKTFIKPSNINGKPEDSVPALMTEDEGSYYMQILETTAAGSENMHLVSANHTQIDICAIRRDIIIAQDKVIPDQGFVENILLQNMISHKNIHDFDKIGLNYQELLDMVQFEAKELDTILAGNFLKIGSKYYTLSDEILFDVGEKVLILCTGNGMEHNSLISLQEIISLGCFEDLVSSYYKTDQGLEILAYVLEQIYNLKSSRDTITDAEYTKDSMKLKLFIARNLVFKDKHSKLDEFCKELSTNFDVLGVENEEEQIPSSNDIDKDADYKREILVIKELLKNNMSKCYFMKENERTKIDINPIIKNCYDYFDYQTLEYIRKELQMPNLGQKYSGRNKYHK